VVFVARVVVGAWAILPGVPVLDDLEWCVWSSVREARSDAIGWARGERSRFARVAEIREDDGVVSGGHPAEMLFPVTGHGRMVVVPVETVEGVTRVTGREWWVVRGW
jgi:hypothetical protein